MGTEIVKAEACNMETAAMSVEAVKGQVGMIQEVMRAVMKDGEHYGVIPGCGKKPSLLKPGAEKLSLTFRLAPSYTVTMREMAKGHREYEILCVLTHITSGALVGQGVGSCSTMEAKYRWRKAEQACPECGNATIIKGKKEYGGGWLCYQKKGGCGAKFQDGDPKIENQNMGRVEHDNPADYYNTVLKMAKKRAHVDAVLTATAASDIFTQDVEDMKENGVIDAPPQDRVKEIFHGEEAAAFDRPAPAAEKKTYAIKDPGAPISEAQTRMLHAKAKELGISAEAMKALMEKICKKTSSKDLTKAEASSVIERLTQCRDEGDVADFILE